MLEINSLMDSYLERLPEVGRAFMDKYRGEQ